MYYYDLVVCRNMYIHMDELYQVLHKYFLYRCRKSVLFSLKVCALFVVFVLGNLCEY